MPQTIKELISSARHMNAEVEYNKAEVQQALHFCLPSDIDAVWYNIFIKFVEKTPQRYWDPEAVLLALHILLKDPARTVSAINNWRSELEAGCVLYFLPSSVSNDEKPLGGMNVKDILRLSTQFHPEYLNYCEHIFKNLLVVYWAVLKKGSVDGKYDIKPAIHVLGKNVGRKLTQGYEERIRNAIAHGQVTYRGTDIKYGPKDSDYSIYPSEFLMLFDELVQSINAMMLGVLLFICHQESHSFKSLQLPPRLITLLASAVIDQKFVEVIGSYESTVSLAGKQLHIGIRTEFLSREFLLYTAAILSYNLLVRGANGYERYLFEVDNSKKISSLMIVLPQNFRVLLDEEASIERLNEIFGDTQLLWHDEHKLIRSYKMWRRLFASRIKIFQQAQHQRIFANNTHHIKRQYRIRSVDNKSVSGKVRVEVTAVLKNFTDSSNRQALRKIIKSVTDEVRNKLVLSTFGGIDPYFGIPSRPAQIWVYLYRLDNTLRSINKGGWHGGNLVAIGERIYGNANVYQPVFVKNPEEIWQGIRLRYSIDPNFLHPVS